MSKEFGASAGKIGIVEINLSSYCTLLTDDSILDSRKTSLDIVMSGQIRRLSLLQMDALLFTFVQGQ